MTKLELEKNLEARANLFKALGHPVRLLILNLVEMSPRHGEELAAILNLNPATISHHLGRLTTAGLLESHKDQYYQVYYPVHGVLDRTLAEMVRTPQPDIPESVQQDAYREKVLRTFFKRGRLVQIPAQHKKLQVILEELVKEFEPGRRYTEFEVNQVLVEYHEDVASLRRAMIGEGYMQRDKGLYWRVETGGQ
jgi:DNA-binding HxlR family transcriptional regulator